MSSRSPQFGRTGAKEPRPAANNASAEERSKARNEDANRRQRLGMATRDMNRLAALNKSSSDK
ncbi:MAG: hypothetical protein JWQ10_4064 [Herbaspirillum sp.]|jgi:hypothetical protein|nr:hypothetical protein [Herbaspirillum sp.]